VRQRLRAEVSDPKIEHHPAGHLPVIEERWREVEALMADAEPYRRLFRIEAGDLSGAARLRYAYEGLAGHASDRQTVHRELTPYCAERFRNRRESAQERGAAGLR